jgi:hypothetical protein
LVAPISGSERISERRKRAEQRGDDADEKGDRTIASRLFRSVRRSASRRGIRASVPRQVERLVLDGFVWTGKGSPTLAKRAERLAEWRASLNLACLNLVRRFRNAHHHRFLATAACGGLRPWLEVFQEIARRCSLYKKQNSCIRQTSRREGR